LGYADYTRNQLLRMGIIPLDIEESHLKKWLFYLWYNIYMIRGGFNEFWA
jgi:hypothetical protein